MTIRAASADDLPVLRAIFRRASLSNDGDRPNLLAHPELLEWADEGLREGRTIVSVDDDGVAGFATTVRRDDGGLELEDLFVDPDRRREGHATRLIDAVVATARESGAVRVEVTGNEHARAFYERVGFVQVGVEDTRFAPAPRMHLPL